jgi:hypothetical protein
VNGLLYHCFATYAVFPKDVQEKEMMKKLGVFLGVGLLTLTIGAALVQGASPSKDKDEIRAMYAQFPAAFRGKDVDAIMKLYAPGDELALYDVTPPRQYVGFNAVRKDYEEFFAAFSGAVDKERFKISTS